MNLHEEPETDYMFDGEEPVEKGQEEWIKQFPILKFPPEIEMLGITAESLLKEYEEEFQPQNDTTLLFVGNTNVGKSSLITKYLQLEEPVKPTVVLEYYYSKRDSLISKDKVKPLVNVWELGSGTIFGSTLLTMNEFPNVTGVICLDLSDPEGLWISIIKMLEILKKYAKVKADYKEVKDRMEALVPKAHPDEAIFRPFPIPLVIIGCKYDVFQKFDPEQKRVICQTLRYVAHVHCAHLFFYSDLNLTLFKTAKEVLNHYAYNDPMSTTVETDHNRAVCIPPFKDSLARIDPSDRHHTKDNYRSLLEAQFKQVDPFPKSFGENPSRDPDFAEPRIDRIRSVKDQELEEMIKEFEEDMRIKNGEEARKLEKIHKSRTIPKSYEDLMELP